MVDRILALLKEKELTPSQFADEIGVQRSGMSHLLSGRNKPSLEFIMKILRRYPDVKSDWLLYGKDEPDQELKSVPGKEEVREATLFDLPPANEEKSESRVPRIQRKDKPEKKVEKIVVFYDDKSFREYDPE